MRIATAGVRTAFAMTWFLQGVRGKSGRADRGVRPYGSVSCGALGRGSAPPAGGEIGEAPPVADAASRFRGSAPIGGHDSGRESVGTTVGKRTPPLRTIQR